MPRNLNVAAPLLAQVVVGDDAQASKAIAQRVSIASRQSRGRTQPTSAAPAKDAGALARKGNLFGQQSRHQRRQKRGDLYPLKCEVRPLSAKISP